MKEHNLLLGKVIRPTGKREFVKFRRIETSKPLEYLCWGIKYVWVEGERRNYYLLSVIDVYSRKILDWLFQDGPPQRQYSSNRFNQSFSTNKPGS